MAPLCYRRYRFPPEIFQHAIWLYLRFTLSYRDVEELLAERGLDVSYETVRRWVLKFGPALACRTAAASSAARHRTRRALVHPAGLALAPDPSDRDCTHRGAAGAGRYRASAQPARRAAARYIVPA